MEDSDKEADLVELTWAVIHSIFSIQFLKNSIKEDKAKVALISEISSNSLEINRR